MKLKINNILILLFIIITHFESFSQSSSSNQGCDSIINKIKWENYYAKFDFTKDAVVKFDSSGNLQIFGRENKKKKFGEWYYFTNLICDSICIFINNRRVGKSYYFKNGEVDIITYINKNKTIDTCYNPKISRDNYLTESFTSDACLQSAPAYYCNGIYKKCFPFNLATDKIEELCFRIAGIGKPVNSKIFFLKDTNQLYTK